MIQAMKKMNSAFTGAVNKVKAMNAMEQKAKQIHEDKEQDDKNELPQLNRRDSNLVGKDATKDSPIDVLPNIVGSGQMYGIGERQEFIEGFETKVAWGSPRQNTVI